MKYQSLIVFAIALFLSTQVMAVIEQRIFYASEDAYVDSEQTEATFNNEMLHIQGFGNDVIPESDVNSDQRSFLKFDVSSLEGKTVVGAYFGIYVDEISCCAAPSAQLYYLDNDNWNEDSITWTNSQPLIATAASIGLDQQLNADQVYEWILYKKDTGFEDYWEDGDIVDGFAGYMLTVHDETVHNFAYFPSSGQSNQPYLRIEYIPEPATLLLFGLGTVLIRKRRTTIR